MVLVNFSKTCLGELKMIHVNITVFVTVYEIFVELFGQQNKLQSKSKELEIY